MLAGGNWIIDQVKIIDVYPKHEQLANIYDQSQGTGGSPYNVLLDLAKMGAPFPLEGAGLVRFVVAARAPSRVRGTACLYYPLYMIGAAGSLPAWQFASSP